MINNGKIYGAILFTTGLVIGIVATFSYPHDFSLLKLTSSIGAGMLMREGYDYWRGRSTL